MTRYGIFFRIIEFHKDLVSWLLKFSRTSSFIFFDSLGVPTQFSSYHCCIMHSWNQQNRKIPTTSGPGGLFALPGIFKVILIFQRWHYFILFFCDLMWLTVEAVAICNPNAIIGVFCAYKNMLFAFLHWFLHYSFDCGFWKQSIPGEIWGLLLQRTMIASPPLFALPTRMRCLAQLEKQGKLGFA